MSTMRISSAHLSWVLSICLTTACATEQVLLDQHGSEPYEQNLAVGDRVEIVTAQLERHEFVVTGISDAGLSGDDNYVAFTDVRIIEVEHGHASPWKTVGRGAAAIVFIVGTAGMVVLASTPMVVMPPPP